jgi:glycosyltransferase involved in cell wall biosynthesis
MNASLVTAVMPCLNEARTIGVCVRKALDCFRALGIEGEVVVADNGSTDGSVKSAQRADARVVHQTAKGYGAALM